MKRILTVMIAVLFAVQLNAQVGVGINETGTDPDASAILDVTSTDKGVLLPRMTETQRNAITLPATGLMIFQTDGTAGFYYNSGTTGTPVWTAVAGTSGGGATNYVGELKDGGIVFYVDHTGEHGLIASLDDLDGGSGVAWVSAAFQSTEILLDAAKSYYDGASNTTAIVGQDATAEYAATLCTAEGAGWYLPANWELNMLYNSAPIISKILNADGDANTNGMQTSNVAPYGFYWSSTEFDNGGAWYYKFRYGYSSSSNKTTTYRVRAVRAF